MEYDEPDNSVPGRQRASTPSASARTGSHSIASHGKGNSDGTYSKRSPIAHQILICDQVDPGEGHSGPSRASRALTQSEHGMRLVASTTAGYVSYLLAEVSKIYSDSKMTDMPPCPRIRMFLAKMTLSTLLDHKIHLQHILHGRSSKLLVQNMYDGNG